MKSLQRFMKGFVWGLSCLAAIYVALYLIDSFAQRPNVGHETSAWPIELANWVYTNLRFSLIPFGVILMAYIYQLRQLKVALAERADLQEIVAIEHWLDLLTGLFFGVGVIWTAIGMRSALLAALGDLDETMAQTLGAFAILQRLVDGGILLALSTTIVGGVGGYLLKVLKSLQVGAELKRIYFDYQQNQQEEVVGLLRALVNQRVDEQPVITGGEA